MGKNNFNKHLEPCKSVSWRRPFRRTWPLILLVFSGTLLGTFLNSCKDEKKQEAITENRDVYYTCSMHLQVHEEHPGNCPVCGMKLIAVPVPKVDGSMNASNAMHIQLSPEQIRLGNIQADTVGEKGIGNKLVLTGMVNFNQDQLASVSARVEGRVDRLYFKAIGEYVEKGAKLYDLYSEELNNAKQEYVNALQLKSSIGNSLVNYEALIESAKTKLLLWGMTNAQIDGLSRSKQASPHTTFYSMKAGYITSLTINEGEYVPEGGTVLQLANLSTVWAEAQVYTTQMSSISKNGNVTVQIPDLNQTVNGTIDFVNPEINPDTRINLLRVTIPNQEHHLHPGMPVYITVNSKQHNGLTVPADAVLRESRGASVWIQTKPGLYEIRIVKTGIAEDNAVEITSGLRAGDVVVTTGAYLLNSEYIFKYGSDPVGMKM
jgi:Cu(I)/Ag(I) efflux system membrane fusion protein